MGSLIRFELKKIVSRKSTLVSCVALFALTCLFMTMNIVQAMAYDYNTNERYTGLEAIEYERSIAEPHAGVLTPERIASEIEQYEERAFSSVDPQELVDLSEAAAYSLMENQMSESEFAALYDPYFQYLLSPWSSNGMGPYQPAAMMVLNGTDPATFYDALREKSMALLDTGLSPDASIPLTQTEYDFWQQKIDAVETPFAYGYAGGWEDILDCISFLVFAMLGICIALTPVFTGEYAERTDAVLLATRYGRTRLVAAKVIASLIFATAYFAACAAVMVAVPLAFYGTGGADLPVQIMVSTSPYNLTVSEAVWRSVALGYFIMLGFSGLTLVLSSRLRSQIAIFAIDAVLLLITGLMSASGILLRALSLFPLNAMSRGTMLKSYLSYEVGPVVLDPVVATSLFWIAVAALCLPLAAVAFRRHQVA